eukprot:2418384-Amphidinium_carterae.1
MALTRTGARKCPGQAQMIYGEFIYAEEAEYLYDSHVVMYWFSLCSRDLYLRLYHDHGLSSWGT